MENLSARFGKALDKVKEKAAEVRERVEAAAAGDGPGTGRPLWPVGSSQPVVPSAAVSEQQQQQQPAQQQHQQQQEPGVAPAGVPADSRAQSVHLCGFDISGVSIAGQETCLILPRAKLALDIGRCPQAAVAQQTVLITHGHLDHIGGVPFHASSRMLLNLPPPRYVVPPGYADKLRALLALTNELQGSLALEYDVQELQQGQELELETGHVVRPFPTVHPLPSQGYILYSLRKKLKAELVGRSQDDIRELRLAGAEVTDTYQIPEVAFTGDTSGELFEADTHPDLYRAKLLIVECTFVDDSVSWEQARERGHIHVTDLVMHAHKFANEAILLTHFSPRYKRQDILDALDANMPPGLRARCMPFLNGFA